MMKTSSLLFGAAMAAISMFGLAPAQAAIPAGYKATLLDTTGASDVYAKGINNSGQVVGYVVDGNGSHAVTWNSAGTMTPLPYLSGVERSEAYRINNAGQIVGKAAIGLDTNGNPINRATLWDSTGAHNLGTLGGAGSFANDINEAGVVVGSSAAAVGSEAFMWTSANGMKGYGNAAPGSPLGQSGFNGVNNNGLMAGTSYRIFSPFRASFAFPNDRSQTILGYQTQFASGMAMAVNDQNLIVGYQSASNGGSGHATIFNTNGTFNSIDSLGFADSRALDINESGVIVGSGYYITDDGADQHAFVYSGGQMVDLLTLLNQDPAPGVQGWTTLFEASAVSDNGLIVGEGIYNGQVHAFVLTPVPEPTTVGVLGVASAALLARRRRRIA